MKHLNVFEDFINDELNNIFEKMKSHNIGDIITRETLYKYIDALHEFDLENEFIINKLWEHKYYILTKLNIDEIDLDQTSHLLVNDYLNLYKKSKWYPPIFYSIKDDMIIDGYHRAEVLEKLNKKTINAWVEKTD